MTRSRWKTPRLWLLLLGGVWAVMIAWVLGPVVISTAVLGYMRLRAAPLRERGATLNAWGEWNLKWAFEPMDPKVTTDSTVESWVPYLQKLGVVELDLNGSRISNQALTKLARLRSLKGLRVVDTSIDDDGLKVIAELKQLQMVDLRGTKITDKGFRYLASMPNLRVLAVNENQVSQEVQADFAREHPNVKIFGHPKDP